MARGSFTINTASERGDWGASRSGRMLDTIRRDMDVKDSIFRERLKNEEMLALIYENENIRENILNTPYRYHRWVESQAISKKMVIKVDRNAGEGQVQGGPGDDKTGMWQGITLGRVAYAGGYKREMKALIGEVIARGVSVMRIGYHEQVIGSEGSQEVGKDVQSIIPEAMQGDYEAKPGQDHAGISEGLGAVAADEKFQMAAGTAGVEALIARKDSHDEALYRSEIDDKPIATARNIRRRAWMRKLRVGEDVGWAPWVYDTEDTTLWWERVTWTVAQVKAAKDLFKKKFRDNVEGYDARNISEVIRGGKTPSTDSMGSDARQAQSEDVLEDDERTVEFFLVWMARPDMKSGGIRKIVAPEMPDIFVERDETSPYTDEKGYGTIPGFYPYYDFAPILPTLTIPERTCGTPPMAAAMPHVEKGAEYNRLRQEGALKSATHILQFHPALKNNKKLLAAIERGDVSFGFISPPDLVDSDGKMQKAVEEYHFSGVSPEIEKQSAIEKMDALNMLGMPPAVFQGVGTAETATQDQMGITASENESGALVAYLEDRFADVLCGIRGIVRSNYDDEDFQRMLGQEGAAVMKAWQMGSSDEGDEITVTFGARAKAQELVEKKLLLEAIQLLMQQVDPITGLPRYDLQPIVEELYRRFELGKPQQDQTPMRQLQAMVVQMAREIQKYTGENPLDPKAGKGGKGGGVKPSEGSGPQMGSMNAGVRRDTGGSA